MDWLAPLHEFAEILSTYAGLSGVTLQALIAYVQSKIRKRSKKRQRKKKGKKK